MDVAKIVQLTELEFHKLLRFTEAVASLESQAEVLFQQVKAKIEESRKVRDDFTNVLAQAHPEFDKTAKYEPHESDFTLHPIAS